MAIQMLRWPSGLAALRDGVRRDASSLDGPVIAMRCNHIPMKAALDDEVGCIRCGQWLGRQQ